MSDEEEPVDHVTSRETARDQEQALELEPATEPGPTLSCGTESETQPDHVSTDSRTTLR